MTPDAYDGLLRYLVELYGDKDGKAALARLGEKIDGFRLSLAPGMVPQVGSLTHQDAVLITYPDQVTEPGARPLGTLADFAEETLTGVVNGMHVLPFYPSTSDDGFAVVDYHMVDPGLGSWEDVDRLARRFRLMVDAVINHTSSSSPWFHGFLQGDPRYRDYYISIPPGADLSQVVRPRTLPLVTRFQSTEGEKPVWTTFSADQVDLNYHNPEVLLDVVDVLLQYVANGVQMLRLDAIAYLWKEFGTRCIHLPQTHAVIKLLRVILDLVAPYVLLVTETNVPHRENLSYYGDGHDEAQLVYNFALPPLVMHAILTGRANALSEWASGLVLPSRQVTFFNFLASHDGIGLNPVREILPPEAIDSLVAAARKHGGLVSSKSNADGSEAPYELNISYFDALSDPNAREPLQVQVDRFIAAQSILLSIVGIPGIYVHSLFGSRSWREGVRLTGRNRTINRQKFERPALIAELADPGSLRAQVYRRFATLLKTRADLPAFDPYGAQVVLSAGDAIFGLLRIPASTGQAVLCLHNLSDTAQPASLDMDALGIPARLWTDRISGQTFVLEKQAALLLKPYQVVWLV